MNSPDNYVQPGFNTLLLGEPGSGKTTCIKTLIDCGITPFFLFTEPNGMSTVSDVPSDKLHWSYIPPAAPDWEDMIDSANKINTMSFKALAQMGDINKGKYQQFKRVLELCNNFKCDRTGEEFGSVSEWGPDRAIIVDSMSGLNVMAMDLVAGSKPTKAMSDWGVAMDILERFITKMCADTKCHFILTSHVNKMQDEVTGAITLGTAALGNKLGPKIPRFFDDVILCKREDKGFVWSVCDPSCTGLKGRNLKPFDDKIAQNFKAIYDSWKGVEAA